MESMNETWRPIAGWENFYEVSDHGNVRSLPRTLIRRNGMRYTVRGRVLRPIPVNGRPQHLAVFLARNGQTSGRLVSVLVREAWGDCVKLLPTSEAAA